MKRTLFTLITNYKVLGISELPNQAEENIRAEETQKMTNPKQSMQEGGV